MQKPEALGCHESGSRTLRRSPCRGATRCRRPSSQELVVVDLRCRVGRDRKQIVRSENELRRWCGCGKTSLTRQGVAEREHVEDRPVQLIEGHGAAARPKKDRPAQIEAYRKRWAEEAIEIPCGLCQCGRGGPTPLAKYSHPSRDWIPGNPNASIEHVREVRGYETACLVRQRTRIREGCGYKRIGSLRRTVMMAKGTDPDGLASRQLPRPALMLTVSTPTVSNIITWKTRTSI